MRTDAINLNSEDDEQLRQFAVPPWQRISCGVIARALHAFVHQAPSTVARDESEKLLGRLGDGQ